MILASEFTEFIETISLGDEQQKRILSAVDGLMDHLQSELNLPRAAFFLQGSFVNGTAVNPPTSAEAGAYDVDIVVIMAEPKETADAALSRLRTAILAHGRYTGRVADRKSCVRIEYAEDEVGRFHVDVVPLKDDPTEGLMAPRREEGWHKTRPREFTEWCRSRGDDFSSTVRLLKRWRDEHQSARSSVKSIVLQVLASEHLGNSSDDGPRLAETLIAIADALGGLRDPPEVSNPALPEENLAARWSRQSFLDFAREVRGAAGIAERAVDSPVDDESSRLWADVLGDEFPQIEADEGVELQDTSHAWSIERMGWRPGLDSCCQIGIICELHRDGLSSAFRRYMWSGVLPNRVDLKYTARATCRGDTWWQVINTGAHAASSGGLRGQIFKARGRGGGEGSSADQAVNWEKAAYTGSHLIEAFLVLDETVIARSGRKTVKIENASRPPRGRRRRR